MGKPVWMWMAFMMVIVILLAFDLGVLHRKTRKISIPESLWLSGFYIGISIIFGLWVTFQLGNQSGMEYFTGFIIEKTLSMDNIFVIYLIFNHLSIPPVYQHRVLFWGILGAIIFRALMIGLGTTLISHFGWVLYIFSAFLFITGARMLYIGDQLPDIRNNFFLNLMRKKLRITQDMHGQSFIVRLPRDKSRKSDLYATPLLVALLLIECVDLIFAVDSIPAILAITLDPYIIYTSNIFAILGLRALYFALAAMAERFKYLKNALACVLMFIGFKILIADWLGWEKFPASISLGVTLGLIMTGVLWSLYKTR